MSVFFPGGEPAAVVIAKLHALLDDLILIVEDKGPTEADISDAPVLFDPRICVRPGTALTGHVGGHPSLDGPTIQTSELYAIDLRAGWARTWSRYYRLAGPTSGRAS